MQEISYIFEIPVKCGKYFYEMQEISCIFRKVQ